MSLHKIYTGERGDGKWSWHIKVGDDIVASDASQGYNNEQDALHSLFGIFFGTWDESFLDAYARWQSYGGEQSNLPPEAESGPNVLTEQQLKSIAIPEDAPIVDDAGGVHPS